jgi:large subunit ribosomal protein L18
MAKKNKEQKRLRRKVHIRKSVNGTASKPRIFVFKSNRYFYAGLANDEKNVVIKSFMCKKNSDDIIAMAKKFAKEAVKSDSLVFDRSGYRYHGLIKTFAEELRKQKVNI